MDIEQSITTSGLPDIHSLKRHGPTDKFRDPGSGRAAAQEQQALVCDLLSGDTQRSKDAGQRDTGGALDVVVVGADPVTVAREDRDGIDVREVLPLDATSRVQRFHRGHELVDKGEVFFAADPVLTQAEIERVIEQILIVRTYIQNDRQAALRRHAGAGGVERELAKRYAHPPGAEIAEPEDALAVGYHDEPHILFRPIAEDLPDPAAVVDRQIH